MEIKRMECHSVGPAICRHADRLRKSNRSTDVCSAMSDFRHPLYTGHGFVALDMPVRNGIARGTDSRIHPFVCSRLLHSSL